MSQLTEEQRRRMEQNRLKALERRAVSQRQATTAVTASQGCSHQTPSLSLNSGISGQNFFKKPEPYTSHSVGFKQQASSQFNSKGSFRESGFKPNSFNGSSSHSSKDSNKQVEAPFTGKRITGTFRLISQERFVVDVGFNPQVIEVFKSIPSKLYDPKTRQWSFDLRDHERLASALSPLRPAVVIGSLPSMVLKSLKEAEKYPPFSSIDLMGLDLLLLEAFMPFQRDAVCFGVSRRGRVLIADDMGLGKTIQALGIADYYRSEWPLLIVTPAIIKYSWAQSIDRWIGSVASHQVSVINSGKDSLTGEIIIMTYDLLARRLKEVQNIGFQVVILDESHMLKSFKTARYKAASSLMTNARRLILLSGTPALSRPSELYTQISGINKSIFPLFQEYGIRYCGGVQQPWGWNFSGSSNMEELQVILRATIMIRRLKSDVITQLPSKQRMTVILDPSSIKSGSKALEEASSYFKGIKGSEKHGALLQYFHQTAVAKYKAICDYVEDLLEDDKKFLVYAHHRIVLDELSKTCLKLRVKYMRIDGTTGAEARQKAVDEFQTNPDIKVAILSITSANTGITLTSAQLVVFGELFWNPGLLIQAEDRVHRIGQVDSVLIQYLVARGTADDEIWPLIQSKLDVLNKAGLTNSNFTDSTSTNQKVKDEGILKYLSPLKKTGNKGILNYFSPSKKKEVVNHEANNNGSERHHEDSLLEAFEDSFLEEVETLTKKPRISHDSI